MSSTTLLSMCRLCGIQEGSRKFHDIFEEELNLHVKINKLLPVVVIEWDPLSHEICENCIDKLNILDEFYDNSIKTDQYLRRLLPFMPKHSMPILKPMINIPCRCTSTQQQLKIQKEDKVNTASVSSNYENEIVDLIHSDSEAEHSKIPMKPKKTLECFLISPISKTDSVYTCRQCYRTYTTVKSSLSHICEEQESSDENSDVDVVESDCSEEKKSIFLNQTHPIPSSKIHVCEVCQKPFTSEKSLLTHERRHFEDSVKKRQRKRKRSTKQSKHKRKSSENLKDSEKLLKMSSIYHKNSVPLQIPYQDSISNKTIAH